MIKCKVCGTANSFDSSVCTNCGNKLRVKRKTGTGKKRTGNHRREEKKPPEDIFSTSDRIEIGNAQKPIEDVFSSDEAYEKVKKNSVLEKIHVLEEEIGDTSEVIEEETKIVPTVINRRTSNDIIRASEKPKKNKKHDIPYRVFQNGSDKTEEEVQKEVGSIAEDNITENVLIEETADNNTVSAELTETRNDQAVTHKKRRRRRRRKKSAPTIEASAEETVSSSDDAPQTEVDNDSKNEGNSPEEELAREMMELSGDDPGKRELPNESDINENEIIPESINDVKADDEFAEAEKTDTDDDEQKDRNKELSEENIGTQDSDIVRPATKKKKKRKKKPTVSSEQNNADSAETQSVFETKEPETIAEDFAADVSDEIKDYSDNIDEKNEKTETVKKPVKKKTTKKKPKQPAEKTEKTDVDCMTVNQKKKRKKKKPAVQTVSNNDAETAADVKADKSEPTKKRRFSSKDISENKYMAALAYLGILIFIPMVARKKSKFCKAHVKQGLVVLIWSLAVSLVTLAAALGLRALILWVLGLGVVLYKAVTLAVTAVMLVLIFIPVFQGAVSAFSGEYKQVSFVGKFADKL